VTDEQGFRAYLLAGGRSTNAADRCIEHVRLFERHLARQAGRSLLDATAPDVESYVEVIEAEPGASAKTALWALRYFFEFAGNEKLAELAGVLRRGRIDRKPFKLAGFRGVDPAVIDALARIGILTIQDALRRGKTPEQRGRLAAESGVSPAAIEELVRLSDLARIQGLKAIRARLYLDAGIGSVEQLSTWEPDALRATLTDYVEHTGFEGIPPLAGEARSAIETARTLPKLVEW
jgi:hypothetical protein